jgi:hypothetical protein
VYATTAEEKQKEAKAHAAIAARKERCELQLAEAEMRTKERVQALEMIRSDIQEVCKMGTAMLRELSSVARLAKGAENPECELQVQGDNE